MKPTEVFLPRIISLISFVCLLLPSAPKATGQIVSDDFNQSSIKSAVWTPVDPVGDGLFETVGAGTGDAHLRITVPAGRNHDAWNPNESPRLMQPSPDTDLDLEAKFDSLPAVTYQFEGILFEDAGGAQLRFDILQDGKPQLQAYVGKNINTSAPAQVSRTPIADVPIPKNGNAGSIYLRVKRSGAQWSFSTSPDGQVWTEGANFTLAFAVASAGVFAGNYQAAGNPPVFAAEVDYFVNRDAPLGSEDGKVINRLPTITLTGPADRATFKAPATINLSVYAADADGTISKVEYFAGNKLIGTATASPFDFTWNNVAAGSYPITAKATDNQGGTATSASISVAVNPASGGGPSYTGLALWLKGDAGTILNGSNVSQWTDQSGQDRNAEQSNAASQPAFVTTDLGKPGLRFDGADDFLTFNLPVNGLDGMSIFLVSNNRKDTTGTGPASAAIFWNETASWGTIYVAPFQSRVGFRFGTGQTGNQPNFDRAAPIGAAYTVTTAIKNGTTDTLFVNGENLWTDDFRSTPVANCRPIGNLGRGYNDNSYFPGDILEVLVYTRALSDTERVAVEQYLTQKYLANKPPTVAITSPAADTTATAPANITVTADAADSDGSISKVEFFAGSALIGTATARPFTVNWNNVAPGNYLLTAKATDNSGASSTSTGVNVAVNPSGGAGPTFSGLALWLKADAGLTMNGSTVSGWADQSGQGRNAVQATAANQPALITTATGQPGLKFDGANDFMTFNLPINGLTGMTILLVTSNSEIRDGSGNGSRAGNAAIFWNETASWGTVYISPFQDTIHWRFGTTQTQNWPIYTRPNPIGTDYSITISEKDQDTDSLYVNGELVMSEGGKQPAITACRDVGNLARGYNDNTYFPGEILEVLVYTRALSDAERQAAEQYLKTKYLSNVPPTVSLTSPAAGATFAASANITVTAQASDSDGTINKVEFFADKTLIGTATTSPYTITWQNAAAGSYSLTARATDNSGASQTSAAVAIVVGTVKLQPVSDDFNNATLNKGVWSSVDPVGGGTFQTVGAGTGDAHLEIVVPDGKTHDAWNPNQSLRLLQTAPDKDFEVEVKFDSLPAVQYQFEGVFVADASGNGLRFDVLDDGNAQLQAFVGRGIGSTAPAQVSRAAISDVAIPKSGNAGTIFLRVKRVGSQWTFSTSPDGTAWTQKASFTQTFTVAQIGVFAGNYKSDGNPPEFRALVDYFVNTAAPLASEDAAGGAATLSVARSGDSLVISWPQSAAGFNLESTDSLAAPNWTAVSTAPIAAGNDNTVTLAPSGSAKFYRLKK